MCFFLGTRPKGFDMAQVTRRHESRVQVATEDEKEMSDIAMPVKRAHKVLRSVAISNSTRMVERGALKEALGVHLRSL